MLFNAPQNSALSRQPAFVRPQLPQGIQSNEEDYDAAYLDARADSKVSQEADLPLFSPVVKTTSIVTSSEVCRVCLRRRRVP